VKDYTETVEQKEARYSAKVIEESSNPSNMGSMSEPDAHGIIHGCCGDTMEIYLRLNGDRIEEATFTTDGRESAIACASGLPEAKVHCAKLTVNTLRQAIDNWHAGGSKDPND
jgi:nitrogen fixation NifU-like protein